MTTIKIKKILLIATTIAYLITVHILACIELVDIVDSWVLQRYGLDANTAKISVYLHKTSLEKLEMQLPKSKE